MHIGYDNKADGATVSATSEISTLPAANVQHIHLSRKWHTAVGVKSAALILDMLAAVSCSLLAVLGTNLTSAATLRLRASNTDPTGAAGELLDTGTVSAGVHDDFKAIYKSFTATSARYWRLDLTDNTVPDNLQIGRVFLGPKWTPTYGMSWDWAPDVEDPSRVEESYGGQLYAEELPKKRRLVFTLSYMSEAEAMTNAHKLRRACGVTRGVLAIPLENGSYVSHQAVWGRMTERSAPIPHRRPTEWAQKFEIEEIL
jgi:hypothetical protein